MNKIEHDLDFQALFLGHCFDTRSCQILTNINKEIDPKGEWKNLNSIAFVDYLRTENEKTTRERRYFISSIAREGHKSIANAIRKHWGIENQLHWVQLREL